MCSCKKRHGINCISGCHKGRCAAKFAVQVRADVIHAYVRGKKNEKPQPKNGYQELSDREKQVFSLLVEGNSSSKIAEILCISSKTVDKHRASLAKKIGIESPVKMVQYAIRQGLIDPSIWEEQS